MTSKLRGKGLPSNTDISTDMLLVCDSDKGGQGQGAQKLPKCEDVIQVWPLMVFPCQFED